MARMRLISLGLYPRLSASDTGRSQNLARPSLPSNVNVGRLGAVEHEHEQAIRPGPASGSASATSRLPAGRDRSVAGSIAAQLPDNTAVIAPIIPRAPTRGRPARSLANFSRPNAVPAMPIRPSTQTPSEAAPRRRSSARSLSPPPRARSRSAPASAARRPRGGPYRPPSRGVRPGPQRPRLLFATTSVQKSTAAPSYRRPIGSVSPRQCSTVRWPRWG
jgi:hypothetical protein